MDLSERESDVEEEDLECKKVSKRIAGVTLESDSFPESGSTVAEERLVRRKKRMKRFAKGQLMDVDPSPKQNKNEKYMDCDGAESHISSSSDESLSGDNRGGEADDEQSDWVGDTTPTGEQNPELFQPPFDRKLLIRKSQTSHHVSGIQKKIEKFAREGGRGELLLDLRLRDRATTTLLHRYMFKYNLEIVRRHRGSVTLKKRTENAPSTSTAR
ncbi:unnamed protein product [Caenorhabditis angaria]|uniref:Uncharacterized protein n=1 Tax=Caenorhabditis angaria TaxID=860376 RepID=A0A9P1IPF9_9PELO|nr:unnamed protein product [Caenorhabditis angaria]